MQRLPSIQCTEVFPILHKLLEKPHVTQVTNRSRPVAVLLPWPVYEALWQALWEQEDRSMLTADSIIRKGMHQAQLLFLSYTNRLGPLLSDEGVSLRIILVQKHDVPVGAVLSWASWSRFEHLLGDDVLLTAAETAFEPDKTLSIVSLRNRALQLPEQFAHEMTRGKMDVMMATKHNIPVLAVLPCALYDALSWELRDRHWRPQVSQVVEGENDTVEVDLVAPLAWTMLGESNLMASGRQVEGNVVGFQVILPVETCRIRLSEDIEVFALPSGRAFLSLSAFLPTERGEVGMWSVFKLAGEPYDVPLVRPTSLSDAFELPGLQEPREADVEPLPDVDDHLALFDRYQSGFAPNSLKTHRAVLASFASYMSPDGAWDFAHRPDEWGVLTDADLAGFAAWLKQRGCARSTYEIYISTFLGYCRLLARVGILSKEAYRELEGLRTISEEEDQQRERQFLCERRHERISLLPEQVSQLAAQPETLQGERDRLIVLLACEHGLSAQAIAGLSASSLDLEHGTLRTSEETPPLRLTQRTLDTVKRYLALWPNETLVTGGLIRGVHRSGRLLAALSERGVSQRLQALGTRIGIAHLTPTDCVSFFRDYGEGEDGQGRP